MITVVVVIVAAVCYHVAVAVAVAPNRPQINKEIVAAVVHE